MDRNNMCMGHEASSERMMGMMHHCRIMCGVMMIVIGVIWLLRITGLMPITPVFIGSIFPLFLIMIGLVLLARAFRRRTR